LVKKQGFVSFLAVTLSAVVLLSCNQQFPEWQNTPADTESSAITQSLTADELNRRTIERRGVEAVI